MCYLEAANIEKYLRKVWYDKFPGKENGGGFLLIPALVLIMNLPMKEAIGTSLLIIAMNSLIGFTGDLGQHPMDWKLLLSLSAVAALGIFIGVWLNQKIDGKKLKKGFGWFILVTGIYILVREIFY